MKSGNLNFLEPSGPTQACNGTVLPFYCSLNTTGISRLKIKKNRLEVLQLYKHIGRWTDWAALVGDLQGYERTQNLRRSTLRSNFRGSSSSYVRARKRSVTESCFKASEGMRCVEARQDTMQIPKLTLRLLTPLLRNGDRCRKTVMTHYQPTNGKY